MATKIVRICMLSSRYEHHFTESKTLVQHLRSLQTAIEPSKTSKRRKESPVKLDGSKTSYVAIKPDQSKASLLDRQYVTSFRGLSGKGHKLYFEKVCVCTQREEGGGG